MATSGVDLVVAGWQLLDVQVAKAKGQNLFLPSASPYRKRFGSWEATLAHFGLTRDAAT